MAEKKPVSMGNLGNTSMKNTIFILITIVVSVLAVFVFVNLPSPYYKVPSAQTITLEDVIIAYAPETKTIVFLDRVSGKVKFSLSDSLSLAIFALKSSEAVIGYSSSLTPMK